MQPNSVTPHLNLANFHWAARRQSEAEAELKTAFRIDPKSEDVNRTLAAFYLTSGRRREAEPYVKGFAAVTKKVEGKLGLADFFMSESRAAEAIAVLEPLTREKDGFTPAKLRLASIQFGTGKKEDAYKTLEEILARHPGNLEALEVKARYLIADLKFDDAIKIADSVVKSDPKAVTVIFSVEWRCRPRA